MSKSIETLLAEHAVDPKQGLTQAEWKKRFAQVGPNTLKKEEKSLWSRLFPFFWGPIPWMIEIAAILSFYLKRWPDFSMILVLLLINASLGFFQEYKAASEIDALKNKLALKARVKREGKWQEVSASDLVPGDIVAIKLGNIIPADLTLIEGEYLTVDQAALTGESLPAEKKKGDAVFSGTIAKTGEMVGIVTATADHTFFGKTAALIQQAKSASHFQQAVLSIGRFLICTTLVIAATLLVVDLFRIKHAADLHVKFGQMAIFLLVIVIAGIPVALPAVLSMTMAVGASKMAKLKAIVSKLIAIEELAGMDILCSDKTGTLTKNTLTVGQLHPFNRSSSEELITCGALASKEGDDPIDTAIFTALPDRQLIQGYQCDKFLPFDPVSKKAEAHVKTPQGKTLIVAKGAPQVILALCAPADSLTQEVNQAVDDSAAHGFRTLGVAKKEEGDGWHFLGLIPLFDPPRDETKQTIEAIKSMKVDIKMVTGDHTAIARETALTLDLGSKIIPASEIATSKEPLREEVNGFSEVFPQHKFDIVKRFQQNGHIVGMTGDGVNDAPALKQADIGIAVANATDAARSAADLILTQPGLMVIQEAISEARRIFSRMKSYAMYRISETYRLLLFSFYRCSYLMRIRLLRS